MRNQTILTKKIWSVEIYKLIASVILTIVMGGFIALKCGDIALEDDALLVSIMFSLIYLFTLLILSRIEKLELVPFLMIAAMLAAVVFARVSMLSFVSMDYYNFIEKWISQMSDMTFGNALVTKIGDYNLPYLYALAVLSRFDGGWLVSVKAFSCVFDVVCAYYVLKIVSLKLKNPQVRAFVFALTLILPTLLLNSAYWGQCDSIYGAFCIASIYYAITKKGTLSMLMFSFAFAFKLQAIFIIPILAVCFIIKNIDWYKLLIVPFVYVVCMMPAIICGRPLTDSLFIYVSQASQTQYNSMTMNAPSIWKLFDPVSYDLFKWVGIMLAGFVGVALVYICYIYKDNITTSHLVTAAYLSATLLPFFLPSMHDRYFFIADILSVCVFFYDRRKWYVVLATVMSSFVCYAIYLMEDNSVYDVRPYALIMLIVLILVTKDFVESLVSANAGKTQLKDRISEANN